MKKLISVTCILIMCLLLNAGFAAAEKPVELVVNNELVKLPYPIKTEKETTLLPLRFFSERLNSQVNYLSDTDTAYLKTSNKEIRIDAKHGVAYIDGMGHELIIRKYDNRIYVPLRFLGEALGAEIEWNSNYRRITINFKDIKKEKETYQNPRIVWQKEVGRVSGKPLVLPNGSIYVPNGHELTAFDKAGNQLWSKPLAKYYEKGAKEQFLGTPVPYKDKLYVATNDYNETETKFTRSIFCVDMDGNLKWNLDSYSTYKGDAFAEPVVPVISEKNNRVYFRDKEGVISYQPDPLLSWRFSSDYEIPVEPVVVERNSEADNLVVIDKAVQGTVYVLDRDRNEQWRHPIQLGKATGMVYDSASHILFVSLSEISFSGGSGILALDLLTNSWKYQNYFSEDRILKMQPIKGELYVTTGENFYRVDRQGNIKDLGSTYSQIRDFYVDHENNIFALHNQGYLRKYKDNVQSWQVNIKNPIGLTVAPWGDVLVFTKDGQLICVNGN